MKIITLWQPYATLIARDLKQFETRSKAINYRGPLLIHAAKRTPKHNEWTQLFSQIESLTGIRPDPKWFCFGAVVAIADVEGCFPMHSTQHFSGQTYDGSLRPYIAIDQQTELERVVGDWQPGRYAWKLGNVQRLADPIPWLGRQGMGPAPDELRSLVEAAAKAPAVAEGVAA